MPLNFGPRPDPLPIEQAAHDIVSFVVWALIGIAKLGPLFVSGWYAFRSDLPSATYWLVLYLAMK